MRNNKDEVTTIQLEIGARKSLYDVQVKNTPDGEKTIDANAAVLVLLDTKDELDRARTQIQDLTARLEIANKERDEARAHIWQKPEPEQGKKLGYIIDVRVIPKSGKLSLEKYAGKTVTIIEGAD